MSEIYNDGNGNVVIVCGGGPAVPRREELKPHKHRTITDCEGACPKCGGCTFGGYGLGYGPGVGVYRACEQCNYRTKDLECPTCEALNCSEHEVKP